MSTYLIGVLTRLELRNIFPSDNIQIFKNTIYTNNIGIRL